MCFIQRKVQMALIFRKHFRTTHW